MEIVLQDYIDVINAFVDNVERIAEKKMLQTGKFEGSHYAAMKQLQKSLNDSVKKS